MALHGSSSRGGAMARLSRGSGPLRSRLIALVFCLAGSASLAAAANVRVNRALGGGAEAEGQLEASIVHFRYDDPNDNPDLGAQDVILVAWNDLNHGGKNSVGYARSVDGGPFVHVLPECTAPQASIGQACANDVQCNNPGGQNNGACGKPLVVPPPA